MWACERERACILARARESAQKTVQHSLVFLAGGAGVLHRSAESLVDVVGQLRVLGGLKGQVEVQRAVPGSVLEFYTVATNH